VPQLLGKLPSFQNHNNYIFQSWVFSLLLYGWLRQSLANGNSNSLTLVGVAVAHGVKRLLHQFSVSHTYQPLAQVVSLRFYALRPVAVITA
jgi:hypothetical protein